MLQMVISLVITLNLNTQFSVDNVVCVLEKVYCWCRDIEYEEMVKCDNLSCKFGWFHFSCVDVQDDLPDIWFCSTDCENNYY